MAADRRYIVGQANPSAVAELFKVANERDELVDGGAPWAFTPVQGGGETDLARTLYAVDRDGNVERAFQVQDLDQSEEGEEFQHSGGRKVLGNFAAQDVVEKFGGSAPDLATLNSAATIGGHYRVEPAAAPKPRQEHTTTLDRVVGAAVQSAFVAAISWASGGWGAIAYALANAADPGGDPMNNAPQAKRDPGLAAAPAIASSAQPGGDQLLSAVSAKQNAVAQLVTYINPTTRQRLDLQRGAPVPPGFVAASRDGTPIKSTSSSSGAPAAIGAGLLLAFLH